MYMSDFCWVSLDTKVQPDGSSFGSGLRVFFEVGPYSLGVCEVFFIFSACARLTSPFAAKMFAISWFFEEGDEEAMGRDCERKEGAIEPRRSL